MLKLLHLPAHLHGFNHHFAGQINDQIIGNDLLSKPRFRSAAVNLDAIQNALPLSLAEAYYKSLTGHHAYVHRFA